MTKLSQCAKCVRDRRNCGHYTTEDDTDCPQYISSRKDKLGERFVHSGKAPP